MNAAVRGLRLVSDYVGECSLTDRAQEISRRLSHERRCEIPRDNIRKFESPFFARALVSGQWRARRHGIRGIPGILGNVESVTYRI